MLPFLTGPSSRSSCLGPSGGGGEAGQVHGLGVTKDTSLVHGQGGVGQVYGLREGGGRSGSFMTSLTVAKFT